MTWLLQAKTSYSEALNEDKLNCQKTEASEDGMQKPTSVVTDCLFCIHQRLNQHMLTGILA